VTAPGPTRLSAPPGPVVSDASAWVAFLLAVDISKAQQFGLPPCRGRELLSPILRNGTFVSEKLLSPADYYLRLAYFRRLPEPTLPSILPIAFYYLRPAYSAPIRRVVEPSLRCHPPPAA
jgi:hypothetical protein